MNSIYFPHRTYIKIYFRIALRPNASLELAALCIIVWTSCVQFPACRQAVLRFLVVLPGPYRKTSECYFNILLTVHLNIFIS